LLEWQRLHLVIPAPPIDAATLAYSSPLKVPHGAATCDALVVALATAQAALPLRAALAADADAAGCLQSLTGAGELPRLDSEEMDALWKKRKHGTLHVL
jgi:hypothetical protein